MPRDQIFSTAKRSYRARTLDFMSSMTGSAGITTDTKKNGAETFQHSLSSVGPLGAIQHQARRFRCEGPCGIRYTPFMTVGSPPVSTETHRDAMFVRVQYLLAFC